MSRIEFQTQRTNKVRLFFFGFAAGFVVFLLFALLILSLPKHSWLAGKKFIVSLIFGLIMGLLMGVLGVVAEESRRVNVMIDKNSFIYTKGKKTERFDLKLYNGPRLIGRGCVELKGSINSRAPRPEYINMDYCMGISFLLPDGRTRNLILPFSGRENAVIVDQIIKYRQKNGYKEKYREIVKTPCEGEKRIDFSNASELVRTIAGRRKRRAISASIITGITLAVCGVSYLFLDHKHFLMVSTFFGLVGLSLAAMIFFDELKVSIKAIAHTPAYVRFCIDEIFFGEDRIKSSDIASVLVTPHQGTYYCRNSGYRTVVLKMTNGFRKRYFFGKFPQGNDVLSLDEYPEFVLQLDEWCSANNIEYRWNIEPPFIFREI